MSHWIEASTVRPGGERKKRRDLNGLATSRCSLVLCDTTGDCDIYIQDVLLDEGLAVRESHPIQEPKQEAVVDLGSLPAIPIIPDLSSEQLDLKNQLPVPNNPDPLCRQFDQKSLQTVPNNLNSTNKQCDLHSNSDSASKSFDQTTSHVMKVMKAFMLKIIKPFVARDGNIYHVIKIGSCPYLSQFDLHMIFCGSASCPDTAMCKMPSFLHGVKCCASFCKEIEEMFTQATMMAISGWKSNMDSVQVYPLGSLLLALESGDKEDSPEFVTISTILEGFSVDDPYWQEEFIIPSSGQHSAETSLEALQTQQKLLVLEKNHILQEMMKDTPDETLMDRLTKVRKKITDIKDQIQRLEHGCNTSSKISTKKGM
ncbi:unnamed protein product [Darwinula stevensoni]|uniref:Uncharacterized protein n=1 Tax=Darwinula stevensoni TaxID=69355 RepID=A0A7R8X6C1_9CRUS|nr:unnamed protein product [Darwinula stevensoni]CAG0881917.1 unnamed protein product [Darwinula stevensoni]